VIEKNVKRIIKTLSADDMLGRDSNKPNEIAKASNFIEKEFEKIGLKRLENNENFKQNFTVTKIEKASTEVKVGDIKVADNEVIIFSESEKIAIAPNPIVSVIDKKMGFWESFQTFNRDSVSRVVFVDSFHVGSFKQALNYYGRSRLLSKRKAKPINVVYVLGKNKSANIMVNATQNVSQLPMNNVVGMLEGKSKKEEVVIFSAHYDHLGNIGAVAGDSIANGADDDASGSTAVVALAKYFKKLGNNERTLVFVTFTAEEIGGYGSKYFSENMNPDKVMAMINIEMIGKASKWGK
jgi:hypothetical protein